MKDWQALTHPDIKDFIRDNENTDIRVLALKKPPRPDWPYPLILDQIKSRQKAKIKIPQWLEHPDIVFPANDTLEQASSTATARYKASLFAGVHLVDLTGGAGIDSWAMLEKFETATIIDSDQNSAEHIAHNIKILSQKTINIQNITAKEFITNMQETDLVLIDPQRRNKSRKGLYRLEDCSPNIMELLPIIKQKAKTICLKTSPMMDIDQGIEQLGCVKEVHILEWHGECKEVLYILTPQEQTPLKHPPISAVKLNNNGHTLQKLTFTREEEQNAVSHISPPMKYLYEPSPAFMKSGGFKTMSKRYNTAKIHAHTHLYTSETPIENFPGRIFKIIQTYPVQNKTLPLSKANLTIRNFPQDVKTLQKKLKIKDGGADYLFACTTTNPEQSKNLHTLIHCSKYN